jgi:hypothetical protein
MVFSVRVSLWAIMKMVVIPNFLKRVGSSYISS